VAPFELVIFDCDGVLIDSERLGVKVDVLALHELGWPLSEAEVIARFVGRSDRENRAASEAHLGRSLPVGWTEAIEQQYRDAFAAELTPVDGVLDALDRICLPTCVASSGTHEHLRYTLSLTGLASEMGANPAGCVVVEDSRPGVEAARAAGMRALAFAGGLTPAELLEGPDTVLFDDMRELPRLLEQAP